ncbi:hypothetical protein [Nocardioides sp. B-3]|uniref:hypothetical protein n=1 Tax=Nocardioides sp. B-3 TaxID=2895565 RepID=UPI0021523D59|nr:hypothetical protein [Nocardioides sp. B-3]UUZ58704.1 hypothetical protein LP418_21710 [Nocardioides sp. B-3]
MGIELDGIISDFSTIANQLGLPGWPAKFDVEYLAAPHKPKALRPGHGAIYVFALADDVTSEAGRGRVLKVGRVGPNSNARFQSQHYSPASSRSNLANSIPGYPALWSWLGIDDMDSSTIREWMLTHLDRANVYVPSASAELIPQLEMYVRARPGRLRLRGLGMIDVPMTNRQVEDLTIQLVLEREHAAGRSAIDTRGKGALADIEGDWLIEVKAFGGSARGADLWLETRRVDAALSEPTRFHLVVVEAIRSKHPRIIDVHGEQLSRNFWIAVARSATSRCPSQPARMTRLSKASRRSHSAPTLGQLPIV